MPDIPQNEPHPLGRCPVCRSSYAAASIAAVKIQGSTSFLHLTCQSCEHSMMLSLRRRREGLVCAGIVTDCNLEDARRFADSEPISVDDVIEMHEALQLDKFPHSM